MNWKTNISRRSFVRSIPSLGIIKFQLGTPILGINYYFASKFFSDVPYAVNDPIFNFLDELQSSSLKLKDTTEGNFQLSGAIHKKSNLLFDHYTSNKGFCELWASTHTLEDTLYPVLFDSFLSINLKTATGVFDDDFNTDFNIKQDNIDVKVTVLATTYVRPTDTTLVNTAIIEKDLILEFENIEKKVKLALNTNFHYDSGKIIISNLGFPRFFDKDGELTDPFVDIPIINRTQIKREFISSLHNVLKEGSISVPSFANPEFDPNFNPHFHLIRNDQFYLLSKFQNSKINRSLSLNNPLSIDYPVAYFMHQTLLKELLFRYVSRKLDEHQNIPRISLNCIENKADFHVTIRHSESRTVIPLVWDVDIDANINFDYYIKFSNTDNTNVTLYGFLYFWSYNYSIEDCPKGRVDEAAEQVKNTIQQKINENQTFSSPFNFPSLEFTNIRGLFIQDGLTINFKK